MELDTSSHQAFVRLLPVWYVKYILLRFSVTLKGLLGDGAAGDG
jgi:hypothetical protein